MKTTQSPNSLSCLLPCLGVMYCLAASSQGGSRRFAYSYETTPMPVGAVEFENSVTWERGIAGDAGGGRFDLRHEIEFGYSEHLQIACYFADWSYEKPAKGAGKATFEDVAVEAIYNLTDPNTTPFGSAVYGELRAGGHLIEIEAKLLLQKNIGRWVFVYNVGGEVAWEGDGHDDEGEIMQSAGVSYQINPSWSLGAEVLHEIAVPDVEAIGHSGVYLGPDVSWRNKKLTLTLAGLWQLSVLSDEPDFQLRTILSLDF